MGKSLQIGSVSGITVQVHWSFALVVAWVVIASLASGSGWGGALFGLAFLLALFGCVILHELGHAFAARYYGIGTLDITLLPIGGVARLEALPRKPTQEMVVALAGPAVNVLIAGVLLLLLSPTAWLQGMFSGTPQGVLFLQQLMFLNVALVAFNLLPAFPMDGGRAVRAALAMLMDYVAATKVAVILGQICAVCLGVLGLYYNPMLLLVAAFIFLGAAAEGRQVIWREKYGHSKVRDAMVRNFRTVSANAPLRASVLDLLETPQQAFPVIDGKQFLGMLPIEDALNAIRNKTASSVRQVITPSHLVASEDDSLLDILGQSNSNLSIPVVRDGELVGILTPRVALKLLDARLQLEEDAIPYAQVDLAPVGDDAARYDPSTTTGRTTRTLELDATDDYIPAVPH